MARGLDPVGSPAAPPPQGFLQGQVEPEGEIGHQATGGEALQSRDPLQGQTPAIALVCHGGTGEPIAKHPVTGLQGGADHLGHVLGPVGGVEQQFGIAAGGGGCGGMEQQLPQGLAERCSSRFPAGEEAGAGRHQAAGGQPLAQPLELGALTAAIDSLQHHEEARECEGGPGAVPPRRFQSRRNVERRPSGLLSLWPLRLIHPCRSTPLAGPSCSRRAFKTTVIELRAINNAAKGGERRMPKPGSKAPAAIGSTIRL